MLRHVNVRHELLLRQLLNHPLQWHPSLFLSSAASLGPGHFDLLLTLW